MLKNKRIVLGVTGSIAAYKAIELTRRLTEAGAIVDVIMTEAATRFIAPLSFGSVTAGNVFTDLFNDPLSHIKVTEGASAMVIAPATANIVGKMANGIADDMLTTAYMAFRGKVIIAPSMNWRMYENPATKKNLEILQSYGVIQLGPEKGALACGESNTGRMAEVEDIIEEVFRSLSKKDFLGKRVVITAGPTREYIDPIRFISNRSSGKMGYALARIASRRGAEVILISGPSNLKPPKGVSIVSVETTSEMRDAVMSNLKDLDILIMAAAVADFSPEDKSEVKIDSRDVLVLRLQRTPDIIQEVTCSDKRPFVVAFSAETGKNLDRARQKLIEKNADIIVFNDVTESGAGFDVDTNKITIIDRERWESFPIMTKEEAAQLILDRITKGLKGGIRQD